MLRSTVSRSVKYGLHFVGIWPGTPFPGLRKIFWVLSTALCQIYQYKYVITHFQTDDFADMVDCLCFALPYTMTMVKLIIVWTNYGVLCEMLSTMEEDCAKYAVVDANNFISKTAELSYRLTSSLGLLYLGAVCCNSATSLLFSQTDDTMPRQLLLNMDLPFNTNESPAYEIVVTVQVILLTSGAYTFGLFSALLLMLILHVGCVIDILCDVLAQVSDKESGSLRFVAMEHQQVILFTEKIEQLFTYISFSQLLSNTVVTCCLGFLVITTLGTENGLPQLLKFFSAYAAICLEIFIYCFAGEYLNIKSQMIVDAAYQISWYELHPNISRQLILLILRSQKGLSLTFGKFSALSLDSFTEIMKASASYMSVLLAIWTLLSQKEVKSKRTESDIQILREMLRSTVSKSIKYGLHVVAFWPGTPFAVVRRLCLLLSTILWLICQCMYVVTHFYTAGLSKLFDCLSLTVTYNLLVIKLAVTWIYRGFTPCIIIHRRNEELASLSLSLGRNAEFDAEQGNAFRVLYDILTTMEEDCVKYSGLDTQKIIPKAAENSERLASTILTFYVVTTFLYTIATLFGPRFNETRYFVLNMDLPFDATESPKYELVVIAQIIHLMLTGYAYGVFTALLLVVIIHTGCHVDVLCNIIRNIASSKDEEQFRFVAVRHQEIIDFSEQIEKIFTYISFAQLLTNTAVSCCLGYIALTSFHEENALPQLFKAVFGYAAICIEIFTYCFAGEYLNVKSDMIVDATYQMTWYNLQPSTSRQVVLLLIRSQKGLRLTFGKFSTLSLETFTGIMKASASYMSVFLAMS
ncbi:uncharacterized protein LOC144476575 [Augochlora pura]